MINSVYLLENTMKSFPSRGRTLTKDLILMQRFGMSNMEFGINPSDIARDGMRSKHLGVIKLPNEIIFSCH